MNVIKNQSRKTWKEIIKRPLIDISKLTNTVCSVLDDIKENGDDAVRKYEKMFDKIDLESLAVSHEDFEKAESLVSKELLDSIILSHNNIFKFHEAQIMKPVHVETTKGVTCWQKSVPIEKVGLYIPGGTAPLFSTVLMLTTPAVIAGCKDVVLCTPPDRQGNVNPAILMAAKISGVNKIYKVGGIQAIGAMAYGTETIPSVYKIFGPGNQYVMAAKQQVSLHGVSIDMPAGPSEVCVIADCTCNPAFVAADLLSQAEHGIDSQVLLITDDENVLLKVQDEVEKQMQMLPRKEIVLQALGNSKLVLVSSMDEAMDLSNEYAPEHLIISTADAMSLADKVVNAGSVFVGKYSCESMGDYSSGTNHTLPTHGYAKAYNGVNLDSYMRKVTFQHVTPEGVMSIGRCVETMAQNESLYAHKNAMTLRINEVLNK